jgi:hypothetical protein
MMVGGLRKRVQLKLAYLMQVSMSEAQRTHLFVKSAVEGNLAAQPKHHSLHIEHTVPAAAPYAC